MRFLTLTRTTPPSLAAYSWDRDVHGRLRPPHRADTSGPFDRFLTNGASPAKYSPNSAFRYKGILHGWRRQAKIGNLFRVAGLVHARSFAIAGVTLHSSLRLPKRNA